LEKLIDGINKTSKTMYFFIILYFLMNRQPIRILPLLIRQIFFY